MRANAKPPTFGKCDTWAREMFEVSSLKYFERKRLINFKRVRSVCLRWQRHWSMQASAQDAAVGVEQEPSPKFLTSAAESRHSLSSSPDSMFPGLLSRDGTEKEAAFNSLGLEFIFRRDPQDIRLFALNIDSDAELERVVIAASNLDVEAIVLKRENNLWWELGHFVCCGPGSGPNEPFVELRQTVWFGTNDIIVHAGGVFGTGVAERRLLIYRAWRGKLYKVFDTVESAYNLSGSEQIRISYPDTNSHSSPRVIVVHRTKEIRSRRRTTCELFRWDAGQFAFVPTAPQPGLCAAR